MKRCQHYSSSPCPTMGECTDICNKPAKFFYSPINVRTGQQEGLKYVCGIHRRSVDKVSAKIGAELCKPINKDK